MSLSRVTNWNAGDVLTAAALNGEFSNILNNGLALISPLTGNLDVNNMQLQNLVLEKLAAVVTAATEGRLYYRTDNDLLEYDTGSAIRTIPNLVECGGRLTLSGSDLLLAPYKHHLIPINGKLEKIPDAGVTLAIGAAAATTAYNIYAFMSGSTMTLEFSATAAATQAGTGVTIKSGDATRTFVGTDTTNSGPGWTTPTSFFNSFSDPLFLGTVAPATPVANTLYRDSIVKMWGSIENSAGTPSIGADVNVASLTDNGAGDVTVTYATAFSSATGYAAVAQVMEAAGGSFARVTAPATGSCRILTITYDTGAPTDCDFSVIAVGQN